MPTALESLVPVLEPRLLQSAGFHAHPSSSNRTAGMADLKVNPTPLKDGASTNWTDWKNTFGVKPPRPDAKYTGFVGQPEPAAAPPSVKPQVNKRTGALTPTARELTRLFEVNPSNLWSYFVTEIGWGAVRAFRLAGFFCNFTSPSPLAVY